MLTLVPLPDDTLIVPLPGFLQPAVPVNIVLAVVGGGLALSIVASLVVIGGGADSVSHGECSIILCT